MSLTPYDHAMFAVAKRRGQILLTDGRTATLVAWKPSRETTHGVRRRRSARVFVDGRPDTIKLDQVVGPVVGEGEQVQDPQPESAPLADTTVGAQQ